MKHHTIRNTVCALVGITTLAVCILACTSFSPDDKKVLYPTFDTNSGAISYSVYDRSSRTSHQVFSMDTRETTTDDAGMVFTRAQWFPDGKRFVASWTLGPTVDGNKSNNITSFAVVPLDNREAVRIMHLANAEGEADSPCTFRPQPIIGTQAFTLTHSNLVSVDLVSGRIRRRPQTEFQHVLFCPQTNRLLFLNELPDNVADFAVFDPETMTKEWQLHITNSDVYGNGWAFSPQGRKAVFASNRKHGGQPCLTLFEEGQSPREISIPVARNETLDLGHCAFSPKGDTVIAAFSMESTPALGFVEVPLDGTLLHWTTLIQGLSLGKRISESPELFEFGLSHDGKTLAVSSAGVALVDKEMLQKDCALFLVDLAHPAHKVIKIPIPLPPNHVFLK
jgi:hypothetical protein